MNYVTLRLFQPSGKTLEMQAVKTAGYAAKEVAEALGVDVGRNWVLLVNGSVVDQGCTLGEIAGDADSISVMIGLVR